MDQAELECSEGEDRRVAQDVQYADALPRFLEPLLELQPELFRLGLQCFVHQPQVCGSQSHWILLRLLAEQPLLHLVKLSLFADRLVTETLHQLPDVLSEFDALIVERVDLAPFLKYFVPLYQLLSDLLVLDLVNNLLVVFPATLFLLKIALVLLLLRIL